MLLEQLRAEVLEANLELVRAGLILDTFGNASGIDREQGLVAIKPSGVPYATMKPSDIVITDLEGKVVEGTLRPSSDLLTHIVLYKRFAGVGGVVHTHSAHATAWPPAGCAIPALGTTHADYFHGPVPCTPELSDEEIKSAYVLNTGLKIASHFEQHGLEPLAVPGVLVAGHAPFAWGTTAADAAHSAVILEYVARMAYYTRTLNPAAAGVSQALLDTHYYRKHGANATYGQK